MPRLFTKILLSFFASLVILFSLGNFFEAKAAPSDPPPPKPATTPVPPNGSWYNQNFSDWFSKVYDDKNPSEIFGERYTAAQVQWVVYSLFSFILNSTGNANVLSCILKNATDLKACQSIISTANVAQPTQATVPQAEQKSLLSLVFDTNRSFSGMGYVKQRLQKFSLIPTANAATLAPGFGFTALEPVQAMWRASRDIAFGMFVLVAIVFAFMIMFRVKISPQVIISVQSAIPKIIMALILTTFSYAIAGFLIDLMYVVIGLVSLIFAGFLPFHDPHITSGIFNFLTLGQPIGSVPIANTPGPQIGVYGLLFMYLGVFPIVLALLLFSTLGAVISVILVIAAGVGLTALIGSGVGNIAIIIGVILFLIVAILLIWNVVKVIWTLLKAFVNILLLTIFAPLQIVAGTFIPNLGFGSWVKNFASNLAVFVITGVLILLCYIFLWQGVVFGAKDILTSDSLTSLGKFLFGTGFSNGLPNPNPPSGAWPPLLGVGTSSPALGLLFVGASFVMFTLIPKTAEIVQSFMSGKPFAYGSGIGEAFGGVKWAWNQTGAPVWQAKQKMDAERRAGDLTKAINNLLPKKKAGDK